MEIQEFLVEYRDKSHFVGNCKGISDNTVHNLGATLS